MRCHLLHKCRVPFDLLDYGDSWTCEACRQRWVVLRSYASAGGKVAHRTTWFRWLLGLD